ncbi:MAG: RNA methyltransferase [Candidatus Competibacteraceae bacterium]|nr:RNA methyltransferase [Candidatus Competibacteraceae bacterium]
MAGWPSLKELETEQKPQAHRTAERLATVDWSFVNREKAHPVESIHPYPAKFIGDIPRALLDSLPKTPDTVVFDPFCGSGTTLVEAQRKGMASIGIDLNPIACLISRVKTAPTPVGLSNVSLRIANAARANRNPARWAIPNVDHWFKEEVQEAVASLIDSIKYITQGTIYDTLRLALSSILVRISNQESDTRYAAISKPIGKNDVFDQFLLACQKLERALMARDWGLPEARVVEADTLKVGEDSVGRQVGLVITSPPYPNAYEYWLYHKYRMWWLGFDPLAVKEQEIGARAHFFKREHHTEAHFWDQMRQTFELIDRVLVPSGFACFVIGRSKIHGHIIDNADILQTVAGERGMCVVSRFERVISAGRKSFNLSHANIKTETVLVLQKD